MGADQGLYKSHLLVDFSGFFQVDLSGKNQLDLMYVNIIQGNEREIRLHVFPFMKKVHIIYIENYN